MKQVSIRETLPDRTQFVVALDLLALNQPLDHPLHLRGPVVELGRVDRHVQEAADDGKDAGGAPGVDEVAARLAHEADGINAPQGAKPEEKSCCTDNAAAGLVTQMLESISDLKARNGFREELIRVLRWLNNSGLLPIRAKTALRGNRPISSRKLQDAKLDHDKTLLQRQVEATDATIDKLVYELYGLTEEEIAIVEGRNNKQI